MISHLRLISALILTLAPAIHAQTVGWRTDGTGRYADAKPVLEWSKDKNVLWSAKLPARGNALPLLLGDRLYTTCEPDVLVCVSTKDGAILWQKSSSYLDLFGADAAEKLKQADQVNKDLQKAQNEANQAKQQLKKLTAKPAPPKADAAKPQPPEPAPMPAEELASKTKELEAKIAEAETKANALRESLAPLKQYVLPATHGTNGYASATPVTDGKTIFCVFGTGVVTAFDLDGNRRWLKLVEKPTHEWGHCASPVLADGKLIVHLLEAVALDPATGNELWRTKARPAWGTGAVTRIGDTAAIALPCGLVLRVADGAVLIKDLPYLDYNSPVVQDGVLYYIQTQATAWKLPAAVAEPLPMKLTPQWKTAIPNDRYYASPLVHDGIVYDTNQAHMFTALDAATGAVLYSQKLELGGGQAYPSVTLGGGLLFSGGESGAMCVLQPGREFKQVGKNSVDRMRASPVFAGERLYLRAIDTLFCIAAPAKP